MQKILKELTKILDDEHVGCKADRALLLDYRAYFESDKFKQIELRKKALQILTLNTLRNVNMAANINHNIALCYYVCGDVQLAKEHLAVAMRLMHECGKGNSYDAYRQLGLMSLLLEQSGEVDAAKKVTSFMQSLTAH